MELLSHYRATAPSPAQKNPVNSCLGEIYNSTFEVIRTHIEAVSKPVTTTSNSYETGYMTIEEHRRPDRKKLYFF